MAEIDIISYERCGIACDPKVLAHHEVNGDIAVETVKDRKNGKEYTVLNLPSPELVCALGLLVSQLPIDNPNTAYGFSLKTDGKGFVQVGRSVPTLYSDSIEDKHGVVFRTV
ncbi:MAG: hypothetical protein ABII80_02745 [bacterium]